MPGAVRSFEATLDWSMPGVEIEATAAPRGSCAIRRLNSAVLRVAPGASRVAQLFVGPVDGPGGGAGSGPAYSVNISRLRGTETELRSLAVEDALTLPPWDRGERIYAAYLDIAQDLARIVVERLDNGQAVSLEAEPEVPLTAEDQDRRLAAPPAAAPSSAPGRDPGARRLGRWSDGLADEPLLGEVQRTPEVLAAPVDVGHRRTINVVVRSADGTQKGAYKLVASRPFCPSDRRFFEPTSSVCTEFCNDGFFGSVATGRCTRCLQPHCDLCLEPLTCAQCAKGFTAKVDGGCRRLGAADGGSAASVGLEVAEQFSRRHVALTVAAASAVTVACIACLLVTICGEGGDITPPLWGWGCDDEEEDGLGSQRSSYLDEAQSTQGLLSGR